MNSTEFCMCRDLRPLTMTVAAVLSLIFTAAADAEFFSGDPMADGWMKVGNSRTVGTFARIKTGTTQEGQPFQPTVDDVIDFDLYTAVFNADQEIATASGGVIAVGQQVIGIGGYINDVTSGTAIDTVHGLRGFGTTPVLQPNKVQVKLGDGSAANDFAASSALPDGTGFGGDAVDGTSAGAGPNGVLLRHQIFNGGGEADNTWNTSVHAEQTRSDPDPNATNNVDTFVPGGALFRSKSVDGVTRYDDDSTPDGLLKSFEFIFSNEALQFDENNEPTDWTVIPLDATFIVTLEMNSQGDGFVNAFGQLADMPPTAPVPQPASMLLLAAGGGMLLGRPRRSGTR